MAVLESDVYRGCGVFYWLELFDRGLRGDGRFNCEVRLNSVRLRGKGYAQVKKTRALRLDEGKIGKKRYCAQSSLLGGPCAACVLRLLCPEKSAGDDGAFFPQKNTGLRV